MTLSKFVAAAVAVWAISGCGGMVAGESGLDVTIQYDGTLAPAGQPLAIAVYETYPPKGVPLAYKVIERYSFPYSAHFEGLPPGDYVIGASIDLDPSDTPHVGMLKAGVDPFGYAGSTERIHVRQNAAASPLKIVLGHAR